MNEVEMKKKIEELEADLWIARYNLAKARKEVKAYKHDSKVLYNTLLKIHDGLYKEFGVYRDAVDEMEKLKGNPYHYTGLQREE